MSSGRPFVASDVDGLREVTKGYGVLFPHGDAEALANIIRKLHDDKAYYDEVADKCHQRALMFDIDKMVDGYEAVYRELVHKYRRIYEKSPTRYIQNCGRKMQL